MRGVLAHALQRGVEVDIGGVTEAVGDHLQTRQGCFCYSFGGYVLSSAVGPVSERFVSERVY